MRRSTQTLFFFLGILACVQVIWWAYLITHQQALIAHLVATDSALSKAETYKIMTIAEGGFFLFVLSLGLVIVYRTHRQELQLQQNQSSFLSAITHELKTPLANVRLCLDTLERPSLTPDQKSIYLNRAQMAIDRLLDEIESLLVVAQGPRPSDDLSQFDLSKLVEETIQTDELQGKVRFENTNSALIRAPYKEGRLIIRSLLDNAVKYGLNKPITVSVERRDDAVAVMIRDQGVGFSPEELKQAFSPFYRGEESRRIDPTGTGLGLSLVQRLANSYGISVTIESSGREQGSLVTTLWPAADKK